MDFPLTTTSANHSWFKTNREYYLWRGSNISNIDPTASFVNTGSGSYLHYPGQKTWALLNWDKAKFALIEAAKFWLDLGVDGFHLEFVDYLAIGNDGRKSVLFFF